MSVGTPLTMYARWQWRSALAKALGGPLLFIGLSLIPLWGIQRRLAAGRDISQADFERFAMAVYTSVLPLVLVLGALMMVNALISTDREKQHLRFLFSRPVVPWQFYLQHFVLSVLLFSLCFALVPLGFSLLVVSVPVVPVIKAAVMYGCLIGALAYLCGALMNKDGLLLLGVALISFTLQRGAQAGELPRWAAVLADGLPPFLTADAVSTLWLAEHAAEPGDVALVFLYALGMLVAALALIRRAPLAR